MNDLISRKKAIDAIEALGSHAEKYVMDEGIHGFQTGLAVAAWHLERLPSEQPDDWMERNKERILQAGKEGREIEFRIGGRLFAIREKAQ